MSFSHLMSIILSKSWSQVTFMLYPTSQNRRSSSRIDSSSSSTRRRAKRRILRSFRNHNLILHTIVHHIQFIAIRFWASRNISRCRLKNRPIGGLGRLWTVSGIRWVTIGRKEQNNTRLLVWSVRSINPHCR